MKCYLIKNSQKKRKVVANDKHTQEKGRQRERGERIEEANGTHTHTNKDWYGKARKKIAEGDNRMFGIR